MTINELEQGMRNLIATQPMITAGANGEVVSGVLSMIDAFHNLNFKINNYPCQDILKFNMSNESQKIENDFANLVCQIMQERGFNLMLYVPRNQPQGPMVNQYGMINNRPIDASMMMGQMMYQNPANQMAQPMQNPMMSQQNFNQMAQPMPMMNQNPMQRPVQRPTFAGNGGYPRPAPVRLEPKGMPTGGIRPQATAKAKINSEAKVGAMQPEVNKTADVQNEAPVENNEPSPADLLMANGKEIKGKTAGRDYLMELLKK